MDPLGVCIYTILYRRIVNYPWFQAFWDRPITLESLCYWTNQDFMVSHMFYGFVCVVAQVQWTVPIKRKVVDERILVYTLVIEQKCPLSQETTTKSCIYIMTDSDRKRQLNTFKLWNFTHSSGEWKHRIGQWEEPISVHISGFQALKRGWEAWPARLGALSLDGWNILVSRVRHEVVSF